MPPFRQFRKSAATKTESFKSHHRYEHWYRDNQIYFITARCRDRFSAFGTLQAKTIFWNRFDHYTKHFGFVPWITSLLDNHYHTLGYIRIGKNLGPMMQRLHGSIAKLVNDTLPQRHLSFWRESGNRDYFDGCIRTEKQCRLAYKYTQRQSVRHGIARNWREYPYTRIAIDLDRGIKRATELQAFLESVPYKHYTIPLKTDY